jgi:hypothetical protein
MRHCRKDALRDADLIILAGSLSPVIQLFQLPEQARSSNFQALSAIFA